MRHRDHDVFVRSIHERHLVVVTFVKTTTGELATRRCVPLDFGPYRKLDGLRYSLLNHGGGSGSHPMGLHAADIHEIAATKVHFDPSVVITWTPTWHLPRAW